MDAPEGQTQVAEHLVEELNDLLTSLSLPLTLTTPYDLTPSLLLAILECILHARLPISPAIRASRTAAAKVAAMKIFLGVLEHDILRVDIGLSEVDPRRLAAGEWDALVFVGGTLCWLARHKYTLSPTSVPLEPAWDPGSTSSTGSNVGASASAVFSHADVSQSSATTAASAMHSEHEVSPILAPVPRVPRCIHEVPTPSDLSIDSQSVDPDASGESCHCSEVAYPSPPHTSSAAPKQAIPALSGFTDIDAVAPPVRYDGWITLADDDVPAFEAWQQRVHEKHLSQGSHIDQSPRSGDHTSPEHISSPYYTLLLLEKRARLLGELARLKSEARQDSPRQKPR